MFASYVPTSNYSLFSETSYLDQHFKRHGKTNAKVMQTIDGTCIKIGMNELWGPRIGNLYYLRLAKAQKPPADHALIEETKQDSWFDWINPWAKPRGNLQTSQ